MEILVEWAGNTPRDGYLVLCGEEVKFMTVEELRELIKFRPNGRFTTKMSLSGEIIQVPQGDAPLVTWNPDKKEEVDGETFSL